MKASSAFWRWFTLGTIAAGVLVLAQSAAVDGMAGLLQVGESSSLRPLIEEQLGPVPLAPGPGHDGQIFYAIGIDLIGEQVPDLLDHAGYRYRRILYPAVAAAGGLLEGWPLLYSMVAVSLLSFGLAAGAVAAIAVRGGKSDWLALVVILNPGMWLSVRLLTSDTLALAMMAGALALMSSRLVPSVALFSLSGLAKDVYLATPAGVAITSVRRLRVFLIVPAIALAAWTTWLSIAMGNGFTGRGNLSMPLVGIIRGSANWSSLEAEQWVYLVFALGSLAAGLVSGLIRRSWLRWPILTWSLLALISSDWVWDYGNNAARAFAPIAVLIALSYVPERTAARTGPKKRPFTA